MTILLVDDEVLICNWLSILISQAAPKDVEVVSVSNAYDALEYCDTHDVSLVITDIKMPQRSGLELLQDLSVSHPGIKTAVLSSYDDYSYIRDVFKLGALDYILKSEMKQEDIEALLDKLRLFSEDTDPGGEDSPDPVKTANDTALLHSFLTGRTAADEFCRAAMIERDRSETGLCLFITDRHMKSEEEKAGVLNILSRTLKSETLKGSCYAADSRTLVCLFDLATNIAEYQQNSMNKFLLLAERNVESGSDIRIGQSMCDTVGQNSDLAERLTKWIKAARICAYYRFNEITEPADIPEAAAKSLKTTLVNHLNMGQYHKAMTCLENFIETSHGSFRDPDQIKAVTVYSISVMYSFVDQLSQPEAFFAGYSRLIRAVNQSCHPEGLSGALESFRESYLMMIEDSSSDISPVIRRVVDYIEENYMHKLTLEGISEHVYLNKTYLSQLFAKNMNMPLMHYIEKTRIQHAKNLLATTELSVLQVSEKTGFSSQSYFTNVFKKAAGVSPFKYRSLFAAGRPDGEE